MERSERGWFDRFDMVVTVLVLADLVISSLGTPDRPALLRWVLVLSLAVVFAFQVIRPRLRVMDVVSAVIPNFALEDNSGVWRRARQGYCYLGVSGDTIRQQFLRELNRNGFHRDCPIRVLLLLPWSEYVRESKAHELAAVPSDEEVAAVSRTIETSAAAYAAMAPRLRIEVRFYASYIRYWAHYVDGEEAFIGYLLEGRPGFDGTVLCLRRGRHGNTLLRYYQEEFEHLWSRALPVNDYFANKAASAGRGGVP